MLGCFVFFCAVWFSVVMYCLLLACMVCCWPVWFAVVMYGLLLSCMACCWPVWLAVVHAVTDDTCPHHHRIFLFDSPQDCLAVNLEFSRYSTRWHIFPRGDVWEDLSTVQYYRTIGQE